MLKKRNVIMTIFAVVIFLSFCASASDADTEAGQSSEEEIRLRSAIDAFLSGTGNGFFEVHSPLELTSDLTLPTGFWLQIVDTLTVAENSELTIESDAVLPSMTGKMIINGSVINRGFVNLEDDGIIVINGQFLSQGRNGAIRVHQGATVDQVTGNTEGTTFLWLGTFRDDDSLEDGIAYFNANRDRYNYFQISTVPGDISLYADHLIPENLELIIWSANLSLFGELRILKSLYINPDCIFSAEAGAKLVCDGSVSGLGQLVLKDGSSFINNGSLGNQLVIVENNILHGICGPNVTWELTPDGTLTLSGSGDTYSYRNSTAPWYCSRLAIKKAVIKDGILPIFGIAFQDCTNLSDVEIGNTVEVVGQFAFKNCTSLKRIVLPASMKVIGVSAFSGCSSLKEIRFLGEVTTFYENCFSDVSAVAYYPDQSTMSAEVMQNYGGSIIWSPFSPDFQIPAEITTIEDEAFERCAFTYVRLSGSLMSIGNRAFAECPNLRHIVIPESTISIADDAFADVTVLTIHGASGSYAEQFASQNGYRFEPISTP